MEFSMTWIYVMAGIVFFILLLCGIRIVNQTQKGVVERLGKFNRIVGAGFHWIIPIIDSMKKRNMTEQIADVDPQDIITTDNLNARVDLQIYFKVKNDNDSIYNSYYNVNDYKYQIICLAQTTARNVIGDMKFADVNSKRNELNDQLAEIMKQQIKSWGVDIVRVELKEITPPKDVQETMNSVIKAKNQKDAALDLASSAETSADGTKRAAIKSAEGSKQARILEAEGIAEALKIEAQGKADAIKTVNEAAEKYFKGNAVELKKIEAMVESIGSNSKIILLNSDIIEGLTNLIKK
jgi:regulator of protease activity HflC (stomatin/prohibitin superfamily)